MSALAILAGLLLLGGAVYLAGLLRAIRRHDYGQGHLLELRSLGITLSCPEWWTLEPQSPAGRSSGNPAVSFKTGHRNGLLKIEDLPATGEEEQVAIVHGEGRAAGLGLALEAVLRREGVILDDPSVRVLPVTASTGADNSRPGGQEGQLGLAERASSLPETPAEARPPLRASVASAGRAQTDGERAYYEFHLLEVDGRRLLLTYTNSVLQGYLDAFYLERILATIQPGGR